MYRKSQNNTTRSFPIRTKSKLIHATVETKMGVLKMELQSTEHYLQMYCICNRNIETTCLFRNSCRKLEATIR